MTIGYLNNFFHQQNDVFEKPNCKGTNKTLSAETNLRTARDEDEFEERLVTSDIQSVQLTKPNENEELFYGTNYSNRLAKINEATVVEI